MSAIDLREELQYKCSGWGAYWRAPDAHGVVLTVEQATELLAHAVGVEVEIEPGASARLAEIARIIESVDARAMATDGPVPSTMQTMTQVEMSRIYALATEPRDSEELTAASREYNEALRLSRIGYGNDFDAKEAQQRLREAAERLASAKATGATP